MMTAWIRRVGLVAALALSTIVLIALAMRLTTSMSLGDVSVIFYRSAV